MKLPFKNQQLVPYFCFDCSKNIPTIDDAFVLDEQSGKYFCSEKCIITFHKPYVKFFQKQELSMRKKFQIVDENLLLTDEEQLMWTEKNCQHPDEVWKIKDALGNSYHVQFKLCGESSDSCTSIVICYVFMKKPSFVLHHTFTYDQELIQFYKWGKRENAAVEKRQDTGDAKKSNQDNVINFPTKNHSKEIDDQEREEVYLSRETLGEIDQMRSELLSELISRRKDSDIALEEFESFGHYLTQTLEKPDEIYEFLTKNNEKILVHISDHHSHTKDKTFYYYVLCWEIPPQKITDERSKDLIQRSPIILPVLGFPSMDQTIYNFYRKGHCVSKRSLN